jgi:hypothetical protein
LLHPAVGPLSPSSQKASISVQQRLDANISAHAVFLAARGN